MKKILFITPQNPENADMGDKKYTWDILNALKYKDDVFIHVVSYLEDSEKDLQYHKLDSLVDRVTYVPFHRKRPWQMALSFYPASISHRKTKAMVNRVCEVLEKEEYDVIVVNMFRMAYLINSISCYPGKKVHISHNVEYLVSKSIYQHSRSVIHKLAYWLDFLKTKYWERAFLSHYDAVTAICDMDSEELSRYLERGIIPVIRPVVDVGSYEQLNPHTRQLIVCGSFTWLPKRINILNVLNSKSIGLLSQAGARLVVAGRADEEVIQIGNSIPNVTVTGFVESVAPYYNVSEVALVPEQSGGGFKLKIAEAVHFNLPIVAIKGAVTDRSMKAGKHFLEAQDFDDLIELGIKLIENRERQEQLVKNSKELFASNYSVKTIHERLMTILFD